MQRTLRRPQRDCIRFFIYSASGTKAGRTKTLKSTLGDLSITEKQADRLGCGSGSRLSPHLENCCLRLSANVAYKSAAKDIEYITGIKVSSKTQQRLVHYQEFEQPRSILEIAELSADGGKARLITPKGEKSEWKDYKAIVSEAGIVASFDQNEIIIDWANQQRLAKPVTCLGDGHDGVWNIFKEISCEQGRREILDWFHLNENLQKVGGSVKRLKQAETYLWKGDVANATALFTELKKKPAVNFCKYLEKHKARIVNYEMLQKEKVCSIGSGAVESGIKQIARRVKISGASWKLEHVGQVLAHRCAYLNGLIGQPRKAA